MPRSYADAGGGYRAGDWNLICDVCGFKIKASDSLHRWDGMIVCRDDFEVRHPQDFVRGRVDNQTVPFSRPEATNYGVAIDVETLRIDDAFVTIDTQGDRFLDVNEVTAEDL